MKDQICEAINNLRVLEFYYENSYRVVEPHSLGVNTIGNDILSAYQIGGQSDSQVRAWKMFDLDKIVSLTVTGRVFSGPEQGYQRNSSKMSSIRCEL